MLLQVVHGRLDEHKRLAIFLQVRVEFGFEHVASGEELANVVAVDLHRFGQLGVLLFDAFHAHLDLFHEVEDLLFLALEEELTRDGWTRACHLLLVIRVH